MTAKCWVEVEAVPAATSDGDVWAEVGFSNVISLKWSGANVPDAMRRDNLKSCGAWSAKDEEA